uniref:Uncharacterized protein n=1 Tax=Arundo donax TaxID=35708 RepID=A0A0A9FZG4_ARUDO
MDASSLYRRSLCLWFLTWCTQGFLW